MSELVVRALVSVIEVCGVNWVWSCEGVVDLSLLFLSSSEDFSLFVAVHETQLVLEVIIIIDAASVAINEVGEFINVCSIHLLVTFNQLVHLLY